MVAELDQIQMSMKLNPCEGFVTTRAFHESGPLCDRFPQRGRVFVALR